MRRFIDLARYKQAWRKLDSKTFRAFYYLWDQADASGVYLIDRDQFKFDNGFGFETARLDDLNAGGKVWLSMSGNRILLVDFLADNYGTLRRDYNPHKPVFRALEKNGLTLNASLNQACFKLEDEDEDEEEDTQSSGKERASEEPPPNDERFEALWKTFQGKGAKSKSREYWQKLTEEDREAIMAKATEYCEVNSGDRLTYRKNLEGWINPAERRWEAPIIRPKGSAMQVALHSADVPPDAYSER